MYSQLRFECRVHCSKCHMHGTDWYEHCTYTVSRSEPSESANQSKGPRIVVLISSKIPSNFKSCLRLHLKHFWLHSSFSISGTQEAQIAMQICLVPPKSVAFHYASLHIQTNKPKLQSTFEIRTQFSLDMLSGNSAGHKVIRSSRYFLHHGKHQIVVELQYKVALIKLDDIQASQCSKHKTLFRSKNFNLVEDDGGQNLEN